MEKRTEFLPLAKATIEIEELNAVEEVLKSGWLTTGAKVKEFEENMQAYLDIKKAIGLTSCTAGLHIALAALGIGSDDEVIVPTYTFVATAHVVEWLGAKPVLVDVEKDTFNIDPAAIEKAITSRTKAIIPVHYAGHACDLGSILQIAKKYNLPVIEDAAHAIGTEYGGKKIGNHSNAAVFSFYVTKTITTAEGGMIVTNNEEFGKKLKSYAYFGMDKDAFNRYSEKGSWFYQIVGPGYKYNMNNIVSQENGPWSARRFCKIFMSSNLSKQNSTYLVKNAESQSTHIATIATLIIKTAVCKLAHESCRQAMSSFSLKPSNHFG